MAGLCGTAAKSQVACGIVDMLEVREKGRVSAALSPFWLLMVIEFCLVLVTVLSC